MQFDPAKRPSMKQVMDMLDKMLPGSSLNKIRNKSNFEALGNNKIKSDCDNYSKTLNEYLKLNKTR